jgi:hypothetical protein
MRLSLAVAAVATLVACKAEEAAPPPPPPAPPSYADFAGHWQMTSNLEGIADSVGSELISNAAGTDWNMKLADRPLIPMRVGMRADSLILISAKYRSILRDRAEVQIRAASVLTADGIRGKLVATYNYPDSQEVVTGTTHGTKVPE